MGRKLRIFAFSGAATLTPKNPNCNDDIAILITLMRGNFGVPTLALASG